MELPVAERQTVALSPLLNDRFELLVGAQLVRAGALTRMRKDTPDFDCRRGEHEFGIEATTRARQEAAAVRSVPVPEFGLTAMWRAGTGITMPGMRVTYKSP